MRKTVFRPLLRLKRRARSIRRAKIKAKIKIDVMMGMITKTTATKGTTMMTTLLILMRQRRGSEVRSTIYSLAVLTGFPKQDIVSSVYLVL